MLFLIFVMFGILVNLQFRSIMENSENDTGSLTEMTKRLEEEKAESQRLLEELAQAELEHDQLLKNIGSSSSSPEIGDLLEQRDYEYMRAGLVAVKGPGIVITMQDALVKGESDITDYIVHDKDVQDILSSLRRNGAEAISINGERVISTTRPRCAGPTIFVNKNRYPPPYVFKVIGDPDALYEGIEGMSQIAVLRGFGIRIEVEKQQEIVVEKYQMYESLEKMLEGIEVVSQ